MQQTKTPLQLAFWLGVAVLAHILVALFGVLSRWLQVRPSPPIPALRTALLVSLIALGTLSVGSSITFTIEWLTRHWRRAQARRRGLPTRQQSRSQPTSGSSGVGEKACKQGGSSSSSGSSTEVHRISADGSQPQQQQGQQQQQQQQDGQGSAMPALQVQQQLRQSPFDAPAAPCCAAAIAGPKAGGTADANGRHVSVQRIDSMYDQQPGEPLRQRPEMPLARGLSMRVQRLSSGRPWLVRVGALGVLTVTFATACACQITAPGFVDPSLVQLINMFTVIGVALFQRVLLHHRLPLLIWPCSAVMLGGAAMVIVPTFGQGKSGGLHNAEGWLGFGLSIGSLAATVIYFVTLQATRKLGFTSLQLQYCCLGFMIAVLLPLSLPIDGADWAAQFGGFTAGDWAMLIATGSVVYVGANFAIQHSTWQLGAPTVSMFYGLRLVAAIVESKIVLDATIISTPVQIAGTVITVVAVSVYMFHQWRQSSQQAAQQRAVAAKEAAAAAAALTPAEPVPPAEAAARRHAAAAAAAAAAEAGSELAGSARHH